MESCMGSSFSKDTLIEDHNKIMESNGDEEIGCSCKEEDRKLIESAKGQIGEVREENERLKVLLAELVKEYESLQMHFFDILRQDHNHQQQEEEATKATIGTADHRPSIEDKNNEENELVSLSLGFPSKGSTKDENYKSSNTSIKEDEKDLGEGLALGLDVKFEPSGEVDGTSIVRFEGSSDEEGKEEEATEIWPPSKVLKTMRSGDDTTEASQQAQLKKARVSIRARCDTQTMNDGCQWRKYGQKIAKGNPCPRAYYRCTVSPSCPVRKQVQRCAEDMSILITTYEGTHNHPLPISATTMASTTSVAASMLQSPSSFTSQSNHSSSSQLTAPIFNSSTPPNYNFNNALNNFSTSSIPRPPHQQLYFPYSSVSTSNSHPTITLDLTSPPPSSSHHQFRKFSSLGFSPTPRYNNLPSPSQSFPPYYNGGNYFNNYGSGTLLPHMNRNQSSGKQPSVQQQQQALQEETIAAATKAITTNPKFQSAIAAALTTYVGATANNNGGAGGFYGTSCSNGNDMDCTVSSSRYMMNNNVSSSSGVNNDQQGNLILFSPLSAASRSASGSVSSDRSNQTLEQWKRKNLTIAPKESNL